MVAWRNDIDVLMLEDIEGIFAFWGGGVVETVAFDAITGVYYQEVGTFIICSFAEVVCEGDVVAPVGGILGFLEVAGMPSVGVCCVED